MHKIFARVSVFIGLSIYSFKRYDLSPNLPHSISGCFLGGFVGLRKGHVTHIFQHMSDMGAALALLVPHHRCMLALGNGSFLVGFFNLVSLRHFLIDSEKIPRFEKNVATQCAPHGP